MRWGGGWWRCEIHCSPTGSHGNSGTPRVPPTPLALLLRPCPLACSAHPHAVMQAANSGRLPEPGNEAEAAEVVALAKSINEAAAEKVGG